MGKAVKPCLTWKGHVVILLLSFQVWKLFFNGIEAAGKKVIQAVFYETQTGEEIKGSQKKAMDWEKKEQSRAGSLDGVQEQM